MLFLGNLLTITTIFVRVKTNRKPQPNQGFMKMWIVGL